MPGMPKWTNKSGPLHNQTRASAAANYEENGEDFE